MVAWLIAMGILSDESGDVGRHVLPFQHRRYYEKRIQLDEKLFHAPETCSKSLKVMRHEPCVLPSVAFAVVVCAVGRGERTVVLTKIPFAVLSSDESQRRIKERDIRRASSSEVSGIFILAQDFGSIGKCSVSKGIFKFICN